MENVNWGEIVLLGSYAIAVLIGTVMIIGAVSGDDE